MPDLTSAIENTISISVFNRGLAGKVFADVKQSGAKVVVKNNTPECVLLSPEEYVRIMDELNDARLFRLASERMSNYDPAKAVSEEALLKDLGISPEELNGFEGVELV